VGNVGCPRIQYGDLRSGSAGLISFAYPVKSLSMF
jgi:hypothetical protein